MLKRLIGMLSLCLALVACQTNETETQLEGSTKQSTITQTPIETIVPDLSKPLNDITLNTAYGKGHIQTLDWDAANQQLWVGASSGIWQYRLNTNNGIHHLPVHGDIIAQDNQRIASINYSTQAITIWDLTDKIMLAELSHPSQFRRVGRFSPNGQWLATSSYDGLIMIWDIEQATAIATFELPRTLNISWDNQNRLLAFQRSEDERQIIVWDIAAQEQLAISPTSTQQLSLTVANEYPIALSIDMLGQLVVWEITTGELISQYDRIRYANFIDDDKTAILLVQETDTTDRSGYFRQYSLNKLTLADNSLTHLVDVFYLPNALAYHSNLKLLAVANAGNLAVIDIAIDAVIFSDSFASEAQRTATSPNFALIAKPIIIPNQPIIQHIELIHSIDGALQAKWELDQTPISALTISPSENFLAIAQGGNVQVRHIDGEIITTVQGFDNVTHVLFTSDDRLLAIGGNYWANGASNYMIRLWDITTNSLYWPDVDLDDIRLTHLAVANHWLAYATENAPNVKVIPLEQGADELLLPAEGVITGLNFDVGGTLLGYSSENGTVFIWQLHPQERLYILPLQADYAHAFAFNNRFLLGVNNTVIEVYDLATSNLTLTTLPNPYPIIHLTLAEDMQTLISTSTDGTINRWQLDYEN